MPTEIERMNPEIKAAWIQWLRDNDDNQGREWLNNNGSFCCLGGLCELAVAAGVAQAKVEDDGIVTYGSIDGLTEENPPFVGLAPVSKTTLPAVVFQWAGIPGATANDPYVWALRPDFNRGDDFEAWDPVLDFGTDEFANNSDQDTLAEINDSWHLNFHQIAAIIDKNL